MTDMTVRRPLTVFSFQVEFRIPFKEGFYTETSFDDHLKKIGFPDTKTWLYNTIALSTSVKIYAFLIT